MATSLQNNYNGILEKLQCQFLCGLPLNCINWEELKDLSWEQQEQLIDGTIAHKLNQQLPVKISYQINFLKRLLQQLEQNDAEVHDAVYERYCAMQQRVAQNSTHKFAYKHYVLPQRNVHLTLRESMSFVAEGTTGLCSWQASLALADYLLQQPELVHNKHVLELGAGTGLCGFILLRCCGAQRLLLTDGSAHCISLMKGNIVRNFPKAVQKSEGLYAVGEQTLAAMQLQWDLITSYERTVRAFETDVLCAADVVYDESVFDELVTAIDFVFTATKKPMLMLLAATVRNECTLNKFLSILSDYHFEVVEEQVVPLTRSELFWDRTTPVKIFKITRKQTSTT